MPVTSSFLAAALELSRPAVPRRRPGTSTAASPAAPSTGLLAYVTSSGRRHIFSRGHDDEVPPARFGFRLPDVRLPGPRRAQHSARPGQRLGDDAFWDRPRGCSRGLLSGGYDTRPEARGFYAPKIDLHMTDSPAARGSSPVHRAKTSQRFGLATRAPTAEHIRADPPCPVRSF